MDRTQYWSLYFENLYQMIVPHYRKRVKVQIYNNVWVSGTVVAGTETIATVLADYNHKYVITGWVNVKVEES